MNNKYVCIHGHFYQPPRENAWLESVELQESAAPFHDWNERINFECYATNTSARILDTESKIINIVNNYSRISFNFGATLLSWLELKDPETYELIQQADRDSIKRFSGHGSAVAQVYNHLIMPLANHEDKVTQVIWGIKDFQHRFHRYPEGMWLAETAVNTETLEVLADYNIKYTILAPRQAKAFKHLNAHDWVYTSNNSIDTRRAYTIKLPSGKSIAVFIYDGIIAQSVAFEGLLTSGKDFANRFIKKFDNNDEPQLSHIATDGESYGHHHKKGEMALADALNFIEEKNDVNLTNYGEFLEKFPPQYELQIHDNSSWSCVHGIERWRNNCGCNGGHAGWQQEWRAPLRFALNWLRDQLINVFEEQAGRYTDDIWAARNGFIDVILDRDNENVDNFFNKYARRQLSKREQTHFLRILEMQRNAMLMFTSCGWFFDEISGLETTQILQYACRAIHYAQQVSEIDLEEEFIYRLSMAPSNLELFGTGSGVYEKNVLPASVSLTRVGMHYAASSIFVKYPQRYEFHNYIVTSEFSERIEAGRQVLLLGSAVVRSVITHSEKRFSFAALYMGQLNLIGSIMPDMPKKDFAEMCEEAKDAFNHVDLAGIINAMQKHFGNEKFTIWQLFKEEKQKIINQITEKNLGDVEHSFRNIYQSNYILMNGLMVSKVAIPGAFRDAVQHVLNLDLRSLFRSETIDILELNRILNEFKKWNVSITDEKAFKLTASERIFTELRRMEKFSPPITRLNALNDVFSVLQEMKIKPDVRKAQTEYFNLCKAFEQQDRAYPSIEWKKEFLQLSKPLDVKIENEVSVELAN